MTYFSKKIHFIFKYFFGLRFPLQSSYLWRGKKLRKLENSGKLFSQDSKKHERENVREMGETYKFRGENWVKMQKRQNFVHFYWSSSQKSPHFSTTRKAPSEKRPYTVEFNPPPLSTPTGLVQ